MPENTEQNDVLVATFGVGCFHFGYKEALAINDLDAVEYVSDVRQFLGTYPNIEDIQISEVKYTSRGRYFLVAGHDTDEENFSASTAAPMDWEIVFTVQIPERIQEEFWGRYRNFPFKAEAKKFQVKLVYLNRMPVAFISAIDGLSARPSYYVILIREYMKKYAPEDSSIEFQCLGPSPFHADFFIYSSDSDRHSIRKSSGYDDIEFFMEGTESVEQVTKDIHDGIATELGLYYSTVRSRSNLYHLWYEFIEELQNALDGLPTTASLMDRIKAFFSAPELDTLSISLIEYEMLLEQTDLSVRRESRRLKTEEGLSRFTEYLNEELDGFQTFQIEKYGRMVEALGDYKRSISDFRLSISTALIGLLSACAGGAAGALIAVALAS